SVTSEVLQHPQIRVGTFHRNREMAPITRGKCPKHIRIFGLPQRCCPACKINIEKSSNAIRRTIHEQTFAIGREIHEVESGPSFDRQVMSWSPVCAPNEKGAVP